MIVWQICLHLKQLPAKDNLSSDISDSSYRELILCGDTCLHLWYSHTKGYLSTYVDDVRIRELELHAGFMFTFEVSTLQVLPPN